MMLRAGLGSNERLRGFLLNEQISKQAHQGWCQGPGPHLQPGQDVVVVEQGAEVHVGRKIS